MCVRPALCPLGHLLKLEGDNQPICLWPSRFFREKFFQEVNSVVQKPLHPMAKTKILVKSLMNRAELLLHVTIAAQSGLTRSISGTPAETPGEGGRGAAQQLVSRAFLEIKKGRPSLPGFRKGGFGPRRVSPLSLSSCTACKSASETKVVSHAVRQPVFLRSMSAPSDLEMIANEDLEFTRSSQRWASWN